jgi:hypothetical protein
MRSGATGFVRTRAGAARPYYVCTTRSKQGQEVCAQPYYRQVVIEDQALVLLQAMTIPDGLAEAVDAALTTYAGQERKTSRQSRRRAIEERLKRLGDLFELGGVSKAEYISKRNGFRGVGAFCGGGPSTSLSGRRWIVRCCHI